MDQLKKLAIVLGIFLSIFTAAEDASAQKIRLRSKVTPTCATTHSWKFSDIYADGNIAVVGSYNCTGVFIFDVSNPDNPVWTAWYNPEPARQFLEAIVIGNRGYFGTGNTGGVHIVDLSVPSNPQLLGIVNSTNGGGYNAIHEMMVFDHGGARYLLENSNPPNSSGNNLKIINVTNPAQAVLKWEFLSGTGGWVHAMHIRGNKMYLSGFSGSNRVDIYDITNLGTQAPTLLGSVAVGGDRNHSAWTNETGEYLYSARELSNGDLRVYDVRVPAAPLLIRTIRAADLNINAITPHNPVVMGNKLYVAWYHAGTQVFDISDPANPIRVGQYDTYQQEFAPSEEEQKILDNAEPWDIVCGSSLSLQTALPTQYGGNWAVFPFLGENKVLLGDLTNGLIVVDASQATAPAKNLVADFDGDRKTDFSVYTPASGNWLVENSSDGSPFMATWGSGQDRAVNGDYDGDGKSDVAVWRPGTGEWIILKSTGGYVTATWGANGDVPMPADYDADGRADIAVWRPANGTWYINQSTLGFKAITWGTATDKAFTGDYDLDGKADIAVWRPSNGTWYIHQSSSSILLTATWGANGDRPLSADFDGDGRSDLAVYRPATGFWYIKESGTNAFVTYSWGAAGDIPIPADYDGDSKADITVFRPSTNDWFRLNSSNGAYVSRNFGQSGDSVLPAAVQPQ